MGCDNGPPTGTVAGNITIGGSAPKEPIRVHFINSIIGQGASATTKDDGSYALDQPIHVAEYTVYFEKVAESDGPVSTNAEVLKSVPKEYRSEMSSPMKQKVEKGANKINLEIPGA